MFEVTFQDIDDADAYWNVLVSVIPGTNEEIFFNSEPRGSFHQVRRVTHKIGGGQHTITVYVKCVRSSKI